MYSETADTWRDIVKSWDRDVRFNFDKQDHYEIFSHMLCFMIARLNQWINMTSSLGDRQSLWVSIQNSIDVIYRVFQLPSAQQLPCVRYLLGTEYNLWLESIATLRLTLQEKLPDQATVTRVTGQLASAYERGVKVRMIRYEHSDCSSNKPIAYHHRS
jgi:hypothetical protein